jgi:hypothetical protein
MNDDPPPRPDKPRPSPREEALAKALRENLRRRKARQPDEKDHG